VRVFWRRYRRSSGAVVAAAVLGVLLLTALSAPELIPHGPWEIVGAPFTPPLRAGHILGTDTLGRDVLAEIVYGSRISFLIGMVSTIVALTVGVLMGALAGYFGGVIDDITTGFVEFFQIIPNFIFAIVLVAIFTPSTASTIAAISTVSWPPTARLVRAEVLSLRNREFVLAAIMSGQSNYSVMFREVLPNALSPVITMAALMVATAILLESAISFLGLGDPNTMSWGYVIGASRTVIRDAWWMSVFPGVAIMLTTLSINLVGDGLSAAMNPKSERIQ
jgi:peptide/nickel transport system permease protein